MPLRKLNDKSVVDSFKKDLSSITFLAGCDLQKIEAQLDVLTDPDKGRYEKGASAKAIWELFFKHSLKGLTENTRGIDELCSYFDKFARYENLLVAVDENYRDHVIHTVWVMLLGFYLRNVSTPYKPISFKYAFADLSGGEAAKHIQDSKEKLTQWESPLWCLIALSHDLGYPIQKSLAANDTISDIIKSFGFLKQTPLDYSFGVVHQTALEELLAIVSAKVAWSAQGFEMVRKAGVRLDFAKSFERLDHGIMSAYLLLTYLDFICDWGSLGEGEGIVHRSPIEASEVTLCSELLYSISAHTNKNVYQNDLGGMADLLFLCDELEEFSRFSMVQDEWRNVKCGTEFEFTQDSLSFRYVFEDEHLGDVSKFFKKKMGKVRRRFELASDGIKDISLTCEDIRKAVPFGFTYTRTLAEENVKEFPSEVTHEDILTFLA